MNRIPKQTLGLLALLVGVGLLLPMTPAEAQNAGTLQGNAENGEMLFKEYHCYACHGYTGETGAGTRLNPPRMNQNGFITYVRNPVNTRMPPYRQAEATDQKLADIYAYVVAMELNSPEVSDIPLLRAILEEVED